MKGLCGYPTIPGLYVFMPLGVSPLSSASSSIRGLVRPSVSWKVVSGGQRGMTHGDCACRGMMPLFPRITLS